MAAKDAFRITVVGESAHAATPSRGRDAVLGIASIILGLHAALGREHDASDLVAFNIGTVEGGRSQSALAREASATGTIRTHNQGTRNRIKAAVEVYVDNLGRALGMAAMVEWANEMPPVVNAGHLVDLARRELPKWGSIRAVEVLSAPAMTSDDFALYGELGPLIYFKLGVTGPRFGGAPLHAADFDVDEECIPVGVDAIEAMTRAVLSSAVP
jgi:metal-dependent amidase/aminoacylase/carboxypeptidase family protein